MPRSHVLARPQDIKQHLAAIKRLRLDDMQDGFEVGYDMSYGRSSGESLRVQSQHSDPTAEIMLDREGLRNRLRRIGNDIERAADLLEGAQNDLDKLAGLDVIGSGRRQMQRHMRRRRGRSGCWR